MSSNSSTPRQIAMSRVSCPVCSKEVPTISINQHLDSGCTEVPSAATAPKKVPNPEAAAAAAAPPKKLASIFTTPSAKKQLQIPPSTPPIKPDLKRAHDAEPKPTAEPPTKRQKATAVLREAMPLAEKMRPQSLDDVCGQDLVGKGGVLRGLIEEGRVPSMILWGTAGCGKTTIARVIANVSSARFVEISATASGVQECKKIFEAAKKELLLTGTKTILFCDEIHRFTKAQQDVFLAPVEKGEITL
jgi:putative ATPase